MAAPRVTAPAEAAGNFRRDLDRAAERRLNGATMAQRNAAEAAARSWLDRLGGRLTSKDAILTPSYFTDDRKFVSLHGAGWRVTMGFSREIAPGMSAQELQDAFRFIAISKSPTPGLDVKHWRITPLTRLSAFKTGVRFLETDGTSFRIHVQTRFFALYGRDMRVHVPADAPTPAAGYFQIRREIPSDFVLTVRY